MIRFAAVGLDHRHIYHHVKDLLAARGMRGLLSGDERSARAHGFRKRSPDLKPIDRRRLIEDPSIQIICCAAVPRDRAGIAVDAMRHGKDVMVDKPGATTIAELAAIRKAVAETGRIFSICFSERFVVPAKEVVTKLVADGAIGRVVQTVGLGPHRLNRAIRPPWFFDVSMYGGILVDIASHQIDQFLFLTGSTDAEIVTSAVANYAMPDVPTFQDFGEFVLRSDRASGYVRVDWYTPDGLPTWGDGRLFLLGTEGFIEVRKYVDLAGRLGTDHVFVSERSGTRYTDASSEPLTYFRKFLADVRDRTATAMPQEHVFSVIRLAIEAQAKAVRLETVLRSKR